MPLIYPVGFLGAKTAGPLTINKVAGVANSASFTAPLGTGSNDLFVLVCVGQYEPGSMPTAVSAGGIALTNVANYSGELSEVSFWFGKVPAGGSVTVSISGSGLGYYATEVYTIKGSTTTAFDNGAGGGSSASHSVNISAGGCLAAIFVTAFAGTSWSGATQTGQFEVYSAGDYVQFADYATSIRQASYAVSLSGQAVTATGGVAAFKP